jgi:protein SCO1/2
MSLIVYELISLPMDRIPRFLPLLLAAGVLAGAVGIWSASQLLDSSATANRPELRAATVFPGRRSLPELQLVDQDGQLFTQERLTGHWTLVFMGFTSCGHVCPMTMAKMRAIAAEMGGSVDVLFVSVDPDRDTPAVIRDYVKAFDEDFTGVTGAPEQIDALANALGAPYFVDKTGGAYTVDHSTALFIIDPEAAYTGVISAPHDVSAILSDLRILLDRSPT